MTSVLSHVANLTRDTFFVNISTVGASDFLDAVGSTFTPRPTLNTAVGSVLLRDMGKTIRTPAQGPTTGNQLVLRKVVVVDNTVDNSQASGTSTNPGEGDAVNSLPAYVNLRTGKWARV
jgi:hypothetical protein